MIGMYRMQLSTLSFPVLPRSGYVSQPNVAAVAATLGKIANLRSQPQRGCVNPYVPFIPWNFMPCQKFPKFIFENLVGGDVSPDSQCISSRVQGLTR